MKKILIGTHNQGKYKEIAYLISKKYKKISPVSLKIHSPKETGKTFAKNSELKAKFFSKLVDFPVISDDSGLCIKALNNSPGIYSARLAKKKGGFTNAMKFILKKLEKVKDRSAFLYAASRSNFQWKISYGGRKNQRINFKKIVGKKVSVMIQFLYLKKVKKLLDRWQNLKR